jgi:protein gp37
MSTTKIEWCDCAWNPVTGCTKISAGCAHCYAETMAGRLKAMGVKGYENGFAVTLHPERLQEPLKWRKPSRVFVCSMGDLFHENVPFEFVHETWDVMKRTPHHQYMVLTKRPERMKEFVSLIYRMETLAYANGWWDHVWFGVTAENQEQADKRIPVLLQIPATVRFVSVEPMLTPVNLRPYLEWECIGCDTVNTGPICACGDHAYQRLDWVICGGESGPNRRPFENDWARDLRDQCFVAGVPFFFKQGRDASNRVVKMPSLDRRIWNQYPEITR